MEPKPNTRALADLPEEEDTEEAPSTNYLFIIAIDNYQNGIKKLSNSVTDAKAFKELLVEEYNFEAENCICLINEKATKANFRDNFFDLNERLTEKDNLVFYFSGHGIIDERSQEGFWVLYDGEINNVDSYLSNDTVLRFIRNSDAKHLYGIIDSCFSSSIFRDELPITSNPTYHYSSRIILTAGREEKVLDGIPGKKSPFAQTLTQSLQDPTRKYYWGTELGVHVRDRIRYLTQDQTPRIDSIDNAGHLGGDMLFLRKDEDPPILKGPITTPSPSEKEELKEKGTEKNVSQTNKIKMDPRQELYDLVIREEFDSVAARLKPIVANTSKDDTLLMLRSRYYSYNKSKVEKTSRPGELEVQRNRLVADFNSFIKSLDFK